MSTEDQRPTDTGIPTEPAADDTGREFAPGVVLGRRYRLGTFLGRGGMGEVWQAFDLKLRVDVALKSLRREHFKNEWALEMLRREVRAAREVVSPNVCRIFDLVEIDGRELVSMEYIDGGTLLGVLRSRGPLELREATEIAAQFLAGLEAIHAAGLVHRDVKPENIMITRSGRVVLMDFGLAKPRAGDRTGTVAGTPAYMAPEQLRGDPVDARADIFAAGVVLAEMVSATGIRDRESRESLQHGIRQDPPQLPDNPWSPVLRRAVASAPARRPASTRELIRALEEVTLRVEGAEDLRPYPGLAAFTEEDAEYFFGRELEVEAMWKKLRRPHLLGLIGPSGAGKSSFLRAGLLAAIPAGWRALICTPGHQPFRALAQRLVPEFSGDTEATGALLRFEEPGVAVSLFSRWRKQHDQALVIVDQFEELFTLNPTEVQARFAELLGQLALEADVQVLLSLRDDFLFHCSEHPALVPIFSELTPLGPPTGAALRRAVVQPALKCGYRFEDDALVEEILAEVENERGALPLLAFAAARLWDRRDRDGGVLTRAAYEEIGGVGGALARHAEATLDSIGSDRISIVREIFRNLVTAQGTRAARDREELLSVFDEVDRTVAREVLDMLVDARLLTSYDVESAEDEGEEASRHRRIEIIHESLLSAWPQLVRWQTQDADSAQLRDQLRQAAEMWAERGRPEDLLWTGTSFKEFQVWRERYTGGLTATEEVFTAAMTGKALRRRRRRRVVVATAFVLLLGITGVIGWLWQQAREESLRAEASNLHALGQNLIEEHPSAALAYALASLERADRPEVRHFALEVLSRGPTAFSEDVGQDALSLAFSPDGEWLAAGGWQGLHKLWKQDGSPLMTLSAHGGDEAVAVGFSGDSRFHVSAVSSGIRLWSLPDAEEERLLDIGSWMWGIQSHGLPIRGREWLGFSPIEEGRGFLVRWWPLEGGEPESLGVWEGEAPGNVVDLDPSGKWLAYADGPDLFVLPVEELETATPKRIGGGAEKIVKVTFHPDGERVATIDASAVIRLWSRTADRMRPLRTFEDLPDPEGAASLYILRFDSTGSRMACVNGFEKATYVWDLSAPPGAEPLVLRRGRDVYGTFGFATHPAGTWLAVADTATVSIWPLTHAYPHVWEAHPGQLTGLVFDPDGEWIASSGWDGTIRLWPLTYAEDEWGRVVYDHGGFVRVGSVSSDGERLAVGLWGGTVLILSLSGAPTVELTGFESAISSPVFDREGRRVAAAGGYQLADDSVIRVWDLESGEVKVLDPGDEKAFYVVEFVPDGRLISGGMGGLRLWDVEAGTHDVLVEGTAMGGVDPTGRYVLGARFLNPDDETAGTRVFIYDLRERVSWDLNTHGDRAFGKGWHPAGQVVTGTADGVIRVGPLTGEEPHLLLGHEGQIRGLAFSPDGNWIASAGDDGTIRLWPTPEGRPFHTLPYEELLDRLRSLTNYRVVRDEQSDTGYRLHLDPFPGWQNAPVW